MDLPQLADQPLGASHLDSQPANTLKSTRTMVYLRRSLPTLTNPQHSNSGFHP